MIYLNSSPSKCFYCISKYMTIINQYQKRIQRTTRNDKRAVYQKIKKLLFTPVGFEVSGWKIRSFSSNLHEHCCGNERCCRQSDHPIYLFFVLFLLLYMVKMFHSNNDYCLLKLIVSSRSYNKVLKFLHGLSFLISYPSNILQRSLQSTISDLSCICDFD